MPRRSRSRNTSFARSGVNPTSASEASVSKKSSVMSDPCNSRTVTATRGLPKIEEPRTKIQEPRTKLQNRPVLGIWFLEFGSCLSFSLSSLACRGKNWSWRDSRSKVYFVSRHGLDSTTYSRGKSAMCGIVGYVGHWEAEPILVEGLRRLEYRGYDSSGLATVTGSQLHLRKRAGRIADLVQYLSTRPVPGCHGISHTRWATHGPATDGNAHPHVGGNDAVALVHNGMIENYAALKRQLREDGVVFKSD